MIRKILLIVCFLSLLGQNTISAQLKTIQSPNSNIEVKVSLKDQVSYSVSYKNKEIITPSTISLTLNNLTLGKKAKLRKSKLITVNETLQPVVREKRGVVKNNYNELTMFFKGNYGLRFRVFDDGVAYRWFTTIKGKIKVYSEEANFSFANNEGVYFPETGIYFTAFQQLYKYKYLDSITPKNTAITPILVDMKAGPKVAITEADLRDYPGMFLTGNSNKTLSGKYAPYILNGEARVNTKSAKRANYLAETSGKRAFPWRVIAIAEQDADLINTEIVYKLGAPSVIGDTSWIKSGKIAWDWYNANNIYGVDFRAGLNTETYKYYIDFASEHNIEYVVFDEGWSTTQNVMELNPNMDMKFLTKYAAEKNVGLILWVEWRTFDENLEAATKRFQEWGIKGIKMDFMNRDDQYIVSLYERVAATCAKRKLLVDFHGAYKPTGIRRTYPNIMTYEGVVGLENGKWGESCEPEYNVTMPFIRMLAGPVDFTPGAMINAQKENFKAIFNRPMSLGTRCHQLAMYVVYESPLQMLADSPTNYLKEKECLEYLSEVPVEWDETIVLDAKVGDYIVIARKNGNDWYISAMTDWTAREIEIDLSKLAIGEFTLEAYADGINADRNAQDYKKTIKKVSTANKLKINLAKGGGWAAILRNVK